MIGSRFAPVAPGYGSPSIYDPRDSGSVSAQDPTIGATVASAVANAQPNSIWDRIGGELRKPGMAAALFRGGAETLRNGFGSGLQAAAGAMDRTHAQEAAAGQQGFENQMAQLRQAVAQQQADQTGDYQQGSLRNDAFRIDETGRSNRAREMIDANGQRIQLHGIDTSAATAQRGQTLDFTLGRERIQQDDTNSQRSHDASIYGTNVGYLADGQRARGAGIGSKAGDAYTETVTKVPAAKAQSSWFGDDVPASPETVTTTRVPLASAPTSAAINALKANPNLRGQFEAKYGVGAAAQFLGGR